MLHYYLKAEEAHVVILANRSAFRLRFHFKNLSSYFIPSTYVPTFLLLVIGYLTFFFPIDDFSDRIMSALTSLLVEAAFFTQVSASIPQTSYLKLVDMWFVFCIIFLFVVMLALVTINTLQAEGNANTQVEEIKPEEPFYMRFNLKINPEPEAKVDQQGEGGACCCGADLSERRWADNVSVDDEEHLNEKLVENVRSRICESRQEKERPGRSEKE
ncbi:glycine receptor subunit alpha-4-like [Portunus trituberculatus]|uniref:glycine receptor subunit alpha-4-like n=1 Tax=Portunus trituberculatus TaxID=210409 RepID=UPI001E1D0CA3|nr:glycine receptor subunit alpha-4-like [Portunus trituberculatus]